MILWGTKPYLYSATEEKLPESQTGNGQEDRKLPPTGDTWKQVPPGFQTSGQWYKKPTESSKIHYSPTNPDADGQATPEESNFEAIKESLVEQISQGSVPDGYDRVQGEHGQSILQPSDGAATKPPAPKPPDPSEYAHLPGRLRYQIEQFGDLPNYTDDDPHYLLYTQYEHLRPNLYNEQEWDIKAQKLHDLMRNSIISIDDYNRLFRKFFSERLPDWDVEELALDPPEDMDAEEEIDESDNDDFSDFFSSDDEDAEEPEEEEEDEEDEDKEPEEDEEEEDEEPELSPQEQRIQEDLEWFGDLPNYDESDPDFELYEKYKYRFKPRLDRADDWNRKLFALYGEYARQNISEKDMIKLSNKFFNERTPTWGLDQKEGDELDDTEEILDEEEEEEVTEEPDDEEEDIDGLFDLFGDEFSDEDTDTSDSSGSDTDGDDTPETENEDDLDGLWDLLGDQLPEQE